MSQVILVGHGSLAVEMKKSAEMIFGELDYFHTVEFFKEEGLDTIADKILSKLKALNEPALIFADLYCGTPYNASCAVALKHPELEISIVSGMSLPLVLETASMLSTQSVGEIAMMLPKLAGDIVKTFDQQLINDDDEEDF
jgi:PTS system sorbose-specific IIA component